MAKLLLVCGAIGVACAPGERPPSAPIRGTLSLPPEAARPGRPERFQVVFAAPQGPASSAAELSIVFNQPLHPLEIADAPVPAIVITPPISGKWLWVGGRALRFVPEHVRLPQASRFTVSVPGDLKAMDGTALGAPYQFEFETPRPAIVRTEPAQNARGLQLGITFTVEMNQAVDPVRFQKAATLSAVLAGGKRQALAFTATRPDPKQPKKLVVRPSAPLPKNGEIVLETSESLTGEEGPLSAESANRLVYHTYGPLVVESLNCDTQTPNGKCAPGQALSLSLSNPVRRKDLRRAISVAPPIAIHTDDDTDEDPNDTTSYLNLYGKFEAGKRYTVTVAPDVSDVYGQALGKPYVQTVTVDDYFPRVRIGLSGDTLAPSETRPVQIGSVNVGEYELLTAPLKPADVTAFSSDGMPGERFETASRLPGGRTRMVVPRAAKNRVWKNDVAVKDALGMSHGVLAMGVKYAKSGGDYEDNVDFRLLKVTDLAVSAKVSRAGSVVWVTRLASGEPVKAASVSVAFPGSKGLRYATDAQGIATIPASDFSPDMYRNDAQAHAAVVVESGDDWTYETVENRLPEWRLPVSTDLSGAQHAYGLMFTERGVYRPGDVVKVKGILRQETPTGNATITGKKLDVTLHSPDDEVLATKSVTTSRFGTFALEVTVPASAPLGGYVLKTQLAGDDFLYGNFDVAEYRPSEFKVSAESARPSYVHGDDARFTIRGDYLFGAPMAGAAVRYTITRGQAGYFVPGSDGFVTDPSPFYADLRESALGNVELASEEGKLDPHGAVSTGKKLDLPGQKGAEVVRVDAEVTDVSRQSIAGSTSVIVHPAEHYVGLKAPTDYFVDAPGSLTPEVLAFSPDGARLAGKKVHVELVERRWTLARQEDQPGKTHVVTKTVDRVAGSCDVVTAAAPAPCTLRVDKAGYYLVIARSRDARGNAAEAAYGVYATGPGGFSWGDNDRAMVDLVPNKREYKVGDVARFLVKSPFPEAEALVTVERAGVYRSQRVKLQGPSPTISVPVTDELRPNAFVSVHLLRPPKAKGTGDPLYRVGYAPIAIDPEARRLKVDVKPSKKELSPGEEVTIDLAVRGADGKSPPAELAVYAVDEGVLMLTGYKTPDPLQTFTAPRPLQVATLETRESMAKISLEDFEASLGDDKGGDGGGGGEGAARSDFRQTAYFNPSVVTDANGRATVKFKLPESLTSYRVMAVATTEGDQYGFGAANVVTSRRLMARPNLPRFLRAGDRVEAGVVVTSKGLAAAHVTVHAALSGVVLEGSADRTIDLPKDGSVEVRFPMRAEAVGDATLRFDVRADPERDAVQVMRKVASPGTAETVALYGSTTNAAAESLGDYSAIRHDTGDVRLSLSSSALVGLKGGADQILDYPYYCTEQLSSRLLPLMPLRDLATAFAFSLPQNPQADAERTIREILSRQRGDGGFAMWPESPDSSPWISAYATWVLDLSAARGAKVPKAARDRAHEYLRAELVRPRSASDPVTAAFIVDVLADGGAPEAGHMTRLFEARKSLPLFARAFLLHALVVGKASPVTTKTLLSEIGSELRIANDAAYVAENVGDEYAALFDSTVRTGALVLRAIVAAEPSHPLVAQLARGLVAQRSNGTYRTTQESAYALVALADYWRAREVAVPRFTAKVWLGEQLLSSATLNEKVRESNATLPLSTLAPSAGGTLVFGKQGSGTLFYEARLRYVRATLPAKPLDEGFVVQKALRSTRPDDLPQVLATIPEKSVGNRFKAGDLVVADLIVVTPSPRDYVVVDDPLPAGFEAVDTGLATTASWLDVDASPRPSYDCDGCESERDARAHGRAFGEAWYRQEKRDDRVLFFIDHMAAGIYHYRYLARATTFGTFVVPPTKAEEMYTPETFGRTATETVIVE